MKKPIILTAAAAVVISVLWTAVYMNLGEGIFLTLAITFWTISYHFIMRLAVGGAFTLFMRNRADLTKGWYRPRKWENKLYKLLKVHKWKGRVPMFVPDYFDFQKHSPSEIAQAMCQAELVHEVILVLNFLPILAAKWVGALPAFVITSLIASVIELVCIIAQRYNRPRVIRLISRKSTNKSKV